jgi:alkanesulfonate monooxygenase SsuD/methylene tetrahydromethanopterin reductase-like flavin-dependent oxidoreductase (luciferase family)
MRTAEPTFGFTIPQRGAAFGLGTIPELLAYGPKAEASGLFDSVWVGDSITAKPRAEAIGLLSALAGATSQVLLGVGCMASFPLRDPALLALQWATLDQVSAGRALLAACNGIVPEGGASTIEGGHYGGVRDIDRPARMEESIRLLRALWSGEPVDWDGPAHHYEGLQIQPTPVQDPCPIHIAANPLRSRYAERAMRRVAALADGWMVGTAGTGIIARLWPILAAHLEEAGKDPATFPVTAYANVHIGDDRNQCLETSHRFLEAYYGPVFTETMTESWTAAGSIDQCAERIREWLDDGATRVTLRITSWDQAGQFERLVGELLPTVSERVGARRS